MISVTKKVLRILNKKQKSFAAAIVVLMVIGALMESLGVSLIYPLVEAISSGSTWNQTWYGSIISRVFGIETHRNYIVVLILLTIVVFVTKSVYLLFEKWVQCSFIAKCRVQLQKKLMHRYLYKPYSFFISASSGEIIRVITSDSTEAFNILLAILTIYTDGLICLVLAATIVIMDPGISCVFIAVFAVNFVVVSKFIKPLLVKTGNVNRYYSARANKWILESINGIKSIKVSSTESYFEKMYQQNADSSIDSQRRTSTISAIPKLFNETFSVSIALVYVLVLVVTGSPIENIIPVLSVFAIAALRLMPCINNISSNCNTVFNQRGGLDNIISTIEENDDIIEVNTSTSSKFLCSFNDSIELTDVNFSYPGSKKLILNKGNIVIQKGQSVGFVGTSGGGKTTTADIILGLLAPQEGQVLVDGVDIYNDLKAWHNIIAYVPQQVFVSDDTVRANVAFGFPEDQVSDEKIWEALRAASLEDVVKEMPDGLDSMVGERGLRLSGGQCQRLGIARALFREPQIILFDEATSALDNETEQAIMRSIDGLKGEKTLLVIAHRLTTIKNCDVVYRVEKGKITKEKNEGNQVK